MDEVVAYLLHKEYNGTVLINDDIKAHLDAYYAIYGAQPSRT